MNVYSGTSSFVPCIGIYDIQTFVYSGSWVVNGMPTMAIKYDDGTVIGLPFTVTTTQVFKVGTDATPDEVGGLFTLPHDIDVESFAFALMSRGATAGNIAFKLYDAGGVLWSSTQDSDLWFAAAAGGDSLVPIARIIPSSPISLAASTPYRLSITPSTTVTNGFITVPYFSAENESDKVQLNGGTDWKLTHRTDAGAWTDVAAGVAPVGIFGTYTPVTAVTNYAWGGVG